MEQKSSLWCSEYPLRLGWKYYNISWHCHYRNLYEDIDTNIEDLSIIENLFRQIPLTHENIEQERTLTCLIYVITGPNNHSVEKVWNLNNSTGCNKRTGRDFSVRLIVIQMMKWKYRGEFLWKINNSTGLTFD